MAPALFSVPISGPSRLDLLVLSPTASSTWLFVRGGSLPRLRIVIEALYIALSSSGGDRKYLSSSIPEMKN